MQEVNICQAMTRRIFTTGDFFVLIVYQLTSIMWPVEMSMLDWAGSSLQDGVELWVEDGLCWGPSLNWEETLLTRDVSVPLRPPAPVPTADPAMLPLTPAKQSWRHRGDLDAMCCRHSSLMESNKRTR